MEKDFSQLFFFTCLIPVSQGPLFIPLCFDSGLEFIPSQWKMGKRRKGKKMNLELRDDEGTEGNW